MVDAAAGDAELRELRSIASRGVRVGKALRQISRSDPETKVHDEPCAAEGGVGALRLVVRMAPTHDPPPQR